MGPWERILDMLTEEQVSEVVANGPNSFFLKINGVYKKLDTGTFFSNNSEYLEGLKTDLNKYIESPYAFDENLFEGPLTYIGQNRRGERVIVKGRCHIALPPVSTTPMLTIAKKSEQLRDLSALAGTGTFDAEIQNFFEAAMKAKLTIAVLGRTGAGKTTFLESICREIDPNDRVGVAEDTPELALKQPNVAYLNSVPWIPGFDPNKVATLSWVVAQFQRMRVDRLIVGETRDKEFANFLTAANSGIEGCLTTLHANSPTEGLRKMTTFASAGQPGLDIRSVNQGIATAIDLIVQLTVENGKHRVDEITEVTDTVSSDSDAQPSTSTLYRYVPETDTFVRPGVPTEKLIQKFAKSGIDLRELQQSPVVTGRGR